MRYNTFQYNSSPYHYLILREYVSVSDEAISKDMSKNLIEFIFVGDSDVVKEVTEKILKENITITDWKSYKQDPRNSDWSN
jgi:SepF-like predicted cell division protein (DUF552 family)